MEKQQIINNIIDNHNTFISKLKSLSDDDFGRKPGNKWSAGQQLDHIIKSVKPVDMALGLPVFVLKMKFGVANRPSRSFEGLVEKYQNALKKNGDFEIPSDFAPAEITIDERDKGFEKLNKLVQKLCKRLVKFSEAELDKYILPHPLIGKVTLREMLHFTAYHALHHERQILENLTNEHS